MRKKARGRGQKAKGKGQPSAELQVVGEKQLQALRKKIEKQAAMRWNPDPAEVQRSVIKLVLTLVELLRKLMERQAIRRMEDRTMTAAETEAVGTALMEIERTIRDIGQKFDLTPEDLNLDLGAIKLL
jgi:gas vesicle protein GvpK